MAIKLSFHIEHSNNETHKGLGMISGISEVFWTTLWTNMNTTWAILEQRTEFIWNDNAIKNSIATKLAWEKCKTDLCKALIKNTKRARISLKCDSE